MKQGIKTLLVFVLFLSIVNADSVNDFVGMDFTEQQNVITSDLESQNWEVSVCDPPGTNNNASANSTNTWSTPIILSALISVIIGVLVYFLRQFVNDSKASAWFGKELYQIFANVLLIFFILFLFVVVNPSIAVALQSYHGLDVPYNLQQIACYYSLNIRDSMFVDYMMALFAQGLMSFAASIQFPFIPFTLVAFDLSLSKFYYMLSSLLDFVLKPYLGAIAEWVIKVPLIQFISTSLVQILLPIGLVMRNFSFTRKAGGGIVALCLALFFVYPALLYINSIIISDMLNVDFEDMISYGVFVARYRAFAFLRFFNSATFIAFIAFMSGPLAEIPIVLSNNILPPFASKALFINLSGYVRGFILLYASNSLGSAIGKVTKLWWLYKFIAPYLSLGIVISSFFSIFKMMVSRILLMAFLVSIILPLFNLSITLTAAKDLSRFLGEEMSFDSLLKLI